MVSVALEVPKSYLFWLKVLKNRKNKGFFAFFMFFLDMVSIMTSP